MDEMDEQGQAAIAAGPVEAPPPAAAPPVAPSLADGTLRQLDPRLVAMHRVVGLIVTVCISLFVLIGGAIAFLVGSVPGLSVVRLVAIWVLVTAALAWFCYAWPPIEFRHLAYRLDDDGIEIRHGVIWRTVVSVPRSRVQHLDVSQGPLQRSFGLGTLRIYTAGTEHAQVDLAGLAHERALWIRDYLLPRDTADVV
jgi:membrane protein YdbS with pleckstrin-like domain